jgi:predicted MFS family arabinose efflux permease
MPDTLTQPATAVAGPPAASGRGRLTASGKAPLAASGKGPLAASGKGRVSLSRKSAFVLLASAVLTLLASSSAPTPLYATYQAHWGFSDTTLTVIFGVYAVAVLLSLLVFGSLSDHIGRRPVLAVSLVVQVIVMLVFATAGGLDVLLLARVLQGIATGAALGAIGAGLVDLHPTHGPVANSAAAMAGTASGALGSALLVQLLPAPTQLVFLVMAALFLIQAVGIAAIAETSSRAPGAVGSLRPTLAMPGGVRRALLIAGPSLIAVWALAGFYGSLGPSLAGLVSGSHSTVLGGASLFVLAMSGSLTVLVFHRTEAQRFALAGTGLVIVGVGVVLWSVATLSAVGFFLGTAVAGAGFGAGFQGGLRTIVPLAQPHQRAGVISVAYVVSYLAMGLPAILAGVVVTHTTLTHTAEWFGAGVMLLAALTAVGLVLTGRRTEQRRQVATGSAA